MQPDRSSTSAWLMAYDYIYMPEAICHMRIMSGFVGRNSWHKQAEWAIC
jgi:hypothetical protein